MDQVNELLVKSEGETFLEAEASFVKDRRKYSGWPRVWQADRLNKYIKLSNQATIIFLLKWLTEADRFYHITNQ